MSTQIRSRDGADAAVGEPSATSPGNEAWALLRTLLGQQRRRFLIAASELDLHPAQAGALLQLDSALPMNELAAMLACDNSNVTGLVDRLELRGLVARHPSPEDRRVKHVVLTGAGRQLRSRLLERVGAPPAGFARLSPAEHRQLRDLLQLVLQHEAAD
jgi:MarR family transcriptional regulator, organic hydroperoxide resistance regulator